MTGPAKKVSIQLRLAGRAPAKDDGLPAILRRGCEALQRLVDAHEYARELDRNVWDFAVEIEGLSKAGFTNSELRWLVCNAYVDHAPELTQCGDVGRVFRRRTTSTPALRFSRKTCFVLTDAGYAFAKSALSRATAEGLSPYQAAETNGSGANGSGANGSGANGSGADEREASEATRPKWDRDRQELRVGRWIVKQFKVPANNQERILAAFEEEGWPIHIDDPLPPSPEQDPKRRLHDTINSLNRNQKRPLIRFLGDGSGQGIRWQLVEVSENGETGNGRAS